MKEELLPVCNINERGTPTWLGRAYPGAVGPGGGEGVQTPAACFTFPNNLLELLNKKSPSCPAVFFSPRCTLLGIRTIFSDYRWLIINLHLMV
jgi:hypothetical protein